METGAIRSFAAIIHDPPHRRDEVAGSAAVTVLPVEQTVRAARSAEAGTSAGQQDADRRRTEKPTIKTGFERDPASGSIVYRWTDQVIDRVILEIPRSDKIRLSSAYGDRHASSDGTTVDRSV